MILSFPQIERNCFFWKNACCAKNVPFLQHNLLRNSFREPFQRLRQQFLSTPNERFAAACLGFLKSWIFMLRKKADFGLLCHGVLAVLHKRVSSLGEKQLMVNLVFQRGQDVTRLQTAIFLCCSTGAKGWISSSNEEAEKNFPPLLLPSFSSPSF